MRCPTPAAVALVALAYAGCGPSRTNLEAMAEHLKANISPPEYETLLPYPFWVDHENTRETTVEATLVETGASLRDGRVVDPAGRELYFYAVRGYTPVPERRHVERQSTGEEISRLGKDYHVIRMYGPRSKD